jgi:hypothetical protein
MSKLKRFLKHGFRGLTIRGRYWLAHPDKRVKLLEEMEEWAMELGEKRAAKRFGKQADIWQKIAEVTDGQG